MAPNADRNPALSDAAKAALAYWPAIEYAAARKLTTADLWSRIRESAAELGLETPGVSIQGVNELRGAAVRIRENARTFEGLTGGRRIYGPLVTQAPWSRSLAEQRALPKFQVRFQHTVTTQEGEQTIWRSTVFEGQLPRTAGELRALVEGDAINLASKYKSEHVGVESLQLLAI